MARRKRKRITQLSSEQSLLHSTFTRKLLAERVGDVGAALGSVGVPAIKGNTRSVKGAPAAKVVAKFLIS